LSQNHLVLPVCHHTGKNMRCMQCLGARSSHWITVAWASVCARAGHIGRQSSEQQVAGARHGCWPQVHAQARRQSRISTKAGSSSWVTCLHLYWRRYLQVYIYVFDLIVPFLFDAIRGSRAMYINVAPLSFLTMSKPSSTASVSSSRLARRQLDHSGCVLAFSCLHIRSSQRKPPIDTICSFS
jgi:hypothetical protein